MQESLFTMAKPEDFVPSDHPLRPIQVLVNVALGRLNGLFNEIYADTGRASIAPEKLMRALLLQVFYSVRSERQLVEQLRYNLLFRWFVGLAIDDAVWDHSVFSKNRDRLLEHAVVEAFFTEIMQLADAKGLLSKEHFSVDGTLIQAWASHKSFRPKDGSDDQTPSGPGRNAQADWKGKPRSNDTRRGGSAIDARTTRHSGYALSQTIRKRIEEHFGWGKTVGRICQTVYRGLRRDDQHFKLTMTASNILRIARMPGAVPLGAAP
jgi:transposase